MLMAFVVSLLTTVPLAALALRPRIGWVGAGFVALWFLLLTGVATSLEFTTTRFFSWQAPLRPAVQILGLVVATTSPLFLLRHWKYRLRWGREWIFRRQLRLGLARNPSDFAATEGISRISEILDAGAWMCQSGCV